MTHDSSDAAARALLAQWHDGESLAVEAHGGPRPGAQDGVPA